jgi:LEA14-like dessication related protein
VSEEIAEEMVDLIFEDKNVKKLKATMKALSRQALELVDQLKLENHIRHKVIMLVQGALEDL